MAPALAFRRLLATPRPGIEAGGRVGRFEGVRDGRLTGWAFDVDAPTRRLEVVLQGAGGWRETLTVDHHRADVRLAAAGDCLCGFSTPVADAPLDEAITCRWADTETPLAGSPWRRQNAVRHFVQGLWLGVDAPAPGLDVVSGYAFDPGRPFQRLMIGVVLEGELVSSGRACRFRREAGLGDGLHGFSLPTPGGTGGSLRLVDVARGLDLLDIGRGRS